jgi:dUTP pyrophosphatase
MEILITRLHPAAVVPQTAYHADAGWDLVAVESVHLTARGGRALVATGIALAIPEGYGGFVLPRSGLASRHGVTCANSPGLIDSGYRGEVKVALVNLDPERDYEVEVGDRIAQLVILALADSTYRVVEKLPDSHRGDGGFGSSGR